MEKKNYIRPEFKTLQLEPQPMTVTLSVTDEDAAIGQQSKSSDWSGDDEE